MVNLLVFILSLYQLNTVTFSELVDTPKFGSNSLNSDDFNPDSQPELPPDVMDYPMVKTAGDETEIDFDDPIASVNIDYVNNAIILKFNKQRQKQRQEALNNNFMRFGRADKNLMRFGKRELENISNLLAMSSFAPASRSERSNGAEGIRDSRGDNFMRFGRSISESKNLMRFGRSSNDFMRFGRAPADFMRFGRTPSDFMRFGRSSSDFMRFGRSPSDFMRFGRSPSDFMRFGRAPSDFMRFGRDPSNFMRFGRSPSDFMRFGRSASQNAIQASGKDKNVYSDSMRFERSADKDFIRTRRQDGFMRLGRAPNPTNSRLSERSASKDLIRTRRQDGFMRLGRAPNPTISRLSERSASKDLIRTRRQDGFMRLGRAQSFDAIPAFSDDSSSSTTEKSPTKREAKAPSESVSPYLENDFELAEMMIPNDIYLPKGDY